MKSFSVLIKLFTLLACFVVLQVHATTLLLKNADYNRNSLVNGKLVSVLQGNVRFLYDDTYIRADEATWYRGSGKVDFNGNVRVWTEMQELTCDHMNYNRNMNSLIVRRNINFFDKNDQIRIVAQKAEYNLDTKHIVLNKDPQLFKYDTTAAETLSIVCDVMEYDDSLQIATGIDNVSITKGQLRSTCQQAFFYNETGVAKLREKPWIYYDVHDLTGDSVDLFFKDEALEGVAVMRNAKGLHKDITVKDTIYTRVTGDSIYMAISDSGTVEKIWTYEDATTLYYSSENRQDINEAHGKVILLEFYHGTTGTLSISGNAECIYFMDDEKENGRNEATGDKIAISFDNGKATYIKLRGDVRGTYYAETQQ